MQTALAQTVLVEDVRFRYGATASEGSGFGLEIPGVVLEAGHALVCVGPSGSGKSTFLHLLAGILVPQTGRIVLGDTELGTLGEAQRRNYRISNIGLVFQSFELLEHLSVRENILLPYYVNRNLTLDDHAEKSMRELADVTGIKKQLGKRPRELSQGERQRVALCRAMVTRPHLLLADEPTGNLDPDNTQTVLDVLMEQVRERETTLVMVTHDHGLVPRFDQVLDFRDGSVTGVSEWQDR